MNELDATKDPLPVTDAALCDGCGLCVRVCPTGALAIIHGTAGVAHPEACEYHGYCEGICPVEAISRTFQILLKRSE